MVGREKIEALRSLGDLANLGRGLERERRQDGLKIEERAPGEEEKEYRDGGREGKEREYHQGGWEGKGERKKKSLGKSGGE